MKILNAIDWFIGKIKGLEKWVKTTSAFVRSVKHFRDQCHEIWNDQPQDKEKDTSISNLAKEIKVVEEETKELESDQVQEEKQD